MNESTTVNNCTMNEIKVKTIDNEMIEEEVATTTQPSRRRKNNYYYYKKEENQIKNQLNYYNERHQNDIKMAKEIRKLTSIQISSGLSE